MWGLVTMGETRTGTERHAPRQGPPRTQSPETLTAPTDSNGNGGVLGTWGPPGAPLIPSSSFLRSPKSLSTPPLLSCPVSHHLSGAIPRCSLHPAQPFPHSGGVQCVQCGLCSRHPLPVQPRSPSSGTFWAPPRASPTWLRTAPPPVPGCLLPSPEPVPGVCHQIHTPSSPLQGSLPALSPGVSTIQTGWGGARGPGGEGGGGVEEGSEPLWEGEQVGLSGCGVLCRDETAKLTRGG